jgi:hypothetical protein
MSPSTPQVGDIIYVDDIDIMAGAWIRGGKATISYVSSQPSEIHVEVCEVPGARWNWEPLAEQQRALKAEYGDIVAGQKMIGNRELR